MITVVVAPMILFVDLVRGLPTAGTTPIAYHASLLVVWQLALELVHLFTLKATAHLNIQWGPPENPGARLVRLTTPIFVLCVAGIQTSLMNNFHSLNVVFNAVLSIVSLDRSKLGM